VPVPSYEQIMLPLLAFAGDGRGDKTLAVKK